MINLSRVLLVATLVLGLPSAGHAQDWTAMTAAVFEDLAQRVGKEAPLYVDLEGSLMALDRGMRFESAMSVFQHMTVVDDRYVVAGRDEVVECRARHECHVRDGGTFVRLFDADVSKAATGSVLVWAQIRTTEKPGTRLVGSNREYLVERIQGRWVAKPTGRVIVL